MSQIVVEFDNTLEQSEIVMPIVSSSQDEMGKYYQNNQSEIMQTYVYGVQVPLISIKGIVIDFDNIIDFSLKSKDVLPTVHMVVRDKYGLINSLDPIGMDNEIRVQIIPRFDNAYKKINLTFYISKFSINDDFISLHGLYKVPALVSTNFKALGQLNTHNLFSNIAKETKLGFATNIKSNDQDKRYVYCDYKSYMDLMNKEINFGGSTTDIYDYWVDLWNNLNLVNIYERYNAIDKDEDMMIWIDNQIKEIGEDIKIIPYQTVALITNHPSYSTNELFVQNYNVFTNSGQSYREGSDKIFSIYDESKKEHSDYLVQDGDIKEDIYYKYEYLGEVYGEYNYLTQTCLRKSLLQKINSEYIQVTLKSPVFGLMRGDKVDFIWYINDSMIENKFSGMDNINMIDQSPQTTIPINEESNLSINTDNGFFNVDRMISGQYLITSCEIRYNNGWQQILTLNRPANQKPKFMLK